MLKTAISCWLPWVGLWIALFCSPLLQHLFERFVSRLPSTKEDVELWLVQEERWALLQLLECVWCQAFWVSFAAGITYAVVTNQPLWFPVFILSYYPISTLLLWHIKKAHQ